MLLISRTRGPECTANAVRSPHYKSVQPDISIFVRTPSRWWDDVFLEGLEESATLTSYYLSVQPDALSLLSPPPSVCA